MDVKLTVEKILDKFKTKEAHFSLTTLEEEYPEAKKYHQELDKEYRSFKQGSPESYFEDYHSLVE